MSEFQAQPLLLRARPVVVEAMRVQENNLYLVTTWCGGTLARQGTRGVWVITDLGQQAFAGIGDWIVRNANGYFYPVPDATLFAKYEGIV